jgi:hypothetical protein
MAGRLLGGMLIRVLQRGSGHRRIKERQMSVLVSRACLRDKRKYLLIVCWISFSFGLAELLLHTRSTSVRCVLMSYASRACSKHGTDEKCV